MRWKFRKTVPYAVLTILAVIFVLPLLWIVLASFDGNASQAVKMPAQWTLDNYRKILSSQTNQRAFANGLFISFIQSLLVVLIAGLAAYPLSRYELRYKNLFLYTILFMTSLPITAVMVPVYKMFLTIGLFDKTMGLILFLTATSMPYGIWLMKNFMEAGEIFSYRISCCSHLISYRHRLLCINFSVNTV